MVEITDVRLYESLVASVGEQEARRVHIADAKKACNLFNDVRSRFE